MPVVQVIAIDGPAASGKSVVGLRLARRLGHKFVDTGAMYRAVTCLALQRRIPLTDGAALSRIAAAASIRIGDAQDDAPPRVYVDGCDLTEAIRAPEVDKAVSQVSRVPGVREALVRLQRAMAQQGGVVMVGRDIGTVVLPDAGLKVFLLASPEERARRRWKERLERGEAADYAEVLADLKRRDKLDTEREVSPLTAAKDAKPVVTDHVTIEQVVQQLWELAHQG